MPSRAVRSISRVVLALLSTFLAAASGSSAQELLTDQARTRAFLEKLRGAIETSEAALEEHRAAVQGAQARAAELAANEENIGLNLLRATSAFAALCDPAIQLPISSQVNGWHQGWNHALAWARPVESSLSDDPIDNAYLWYGRYDFNAALQRFDRYEASMEQRASGLEQLCAELEAGFFARLRELAQQLDENNQLGERAAADGNDDEVARLRQRGSELLAELDRVRGEMRDWLSDRTADGRFGLRAAIEDLERLEVPERGRIDREHTEPRQIPFANVDTFGVTFRGERIPSGLRPSDIRTPRGLEVVAVSGGGPELYVHFRRTGSLAAGSHEIDIAGESVPFTFLDAPPDPIRLGIDSLVERAEAPPPANDASVAEVPPDGRGTYLTPTLLTDHPQPVSGSWRIAGGGDSDTATNEERVLQLAFVDDGETLVLMAEGAQPHSDDALTPHLRVENSELTGILGQYESSGSCYAGLRTTVERTHQNCPQYTWYSPSTLCFEEGNLRASEAVVARKNDNQCEKTDATDRLDASYERFEGVTFAPFSAGRYIHLVAAPAVGDQPAQYRAAVRLQWDYRLLEPAGLTLTISRNEGNEPPRTFTLSPEQGVHEFVADTPGVYRFQFEVTDGNGDRNHREVAAAIIPGIPGIDR